MLSTGKQTDKLTNATKNITSFAKEVITQRTSVIKVDYTRENTRSKCNDFIMHMINSNRQEDFYLSLTSSVHLSPCSCKHKATLRPT